MAPLPCLQWYKDVQDAAASALEGRPLAGALLSRDQGSVPSTDFLSTLGLGTDLANFTRAGGLMGSGFDTTPLRTALQQAQSAREGEGEATAAPTTPASSASVFPLTPGFITQLGDRARELFSGEGVQQALGDGQVLSAVGLDGTTLEQIQAAIDAAGGQDTAVGSFLQQLFDTIFPAQDGASLFQSAAGLREGGILSRVSSGQCALGRQRCAARHRVWPPQPCANRSLSMVLSCHSHARTCQVPRKGVLSAHAPPSELTRSLCLPPVPRSSWMARSAGVACSRALRAWGMPPPQPLRTRRLALSQSRRAQCPVQPSGLWRALRPVTRTDGALVVCRPCGAGREPCW